MSSCSTAIVRSIQRVVPSGATTVSGGKLVGVTGGSCSNSAVSVGASGTLGVLVVATDAMGTSKQVVQSYLWSNSYYKPYWDPTTGPDHSKGIIDPGMAFRFTTVVSLLTGTMFLMWLGEQITERGLGNGISIIIFAGIAAGLPNALVSSFDLVRNGSIGPLAAIIIVALVPIFFLERVEGRKLGCRRHATHILERAPRLTRQGHAS